MIIKDQSDVEVGIYHNGDFRVFLTGIEANLYKMACELFLYEFESMDETISKEVWRNREHQWQKEGKCHAVIYTGISGFDFGYPIHLKIAAIKHCCCLLTNAESKLPTLGYDHDPLKVTAEGLALAPLYWLAQGTKRDFDYFQECEDLFSLIWEVGLSTDALGINHGFEYYGWKSEQEQREFMDCYPSGQDDHDKDKWQRLIYEISDRLLASYDSDWQMFFHKAEVYENYIQGTNLLSSNDHNLQMPITQEMDLDDHDPVFIPNFSIKKLGKVSLGDHNNLPDSPGIYFAIDSASRVWYVGVSTSSLRQRHSQHEKQQQFKKNKVQHIAYFVWNDEQDLNEWEFGYIQKFDPPLNMNLTQKDLPQINLGYSEDHFVSRYKEIKQQIALLSLELEELKPNLVTLLEVNGGKLKTSDFSGYTQTRRSWQYSKEIETKKQEIKLLEEQEVKSGVATVKSLTTYPVFRFR